MSILEPFFRSRRPSLPEQLPTKRSTYGIVWQDGPPGLVPSPLLPRRQRQGLSSPMGLSKLPYELLADIFRALCGNELRNVRLVCREWDRASRAWVARMDFQTLTVFLTGQHLRMLMAFGKRFGGFGIVARVCVVVGPDSGGFSVRGLTQALGRYTVLKVAGALYQSRTNAVRAAGKKIAKRVQEIEQGYLGCWAHGNQRRIYLPNVREMTRFLAFYARSVVSQKVMRLSRSDVRLLAEARETFLDCELYKVEMDFRPEMLEVNGREFGSAAPQYPYQLALFCSGQDHRLTTTESMTRLLP